MDHRAIFVARQPIFDVHEKVWAYELLFRGSASAKTADVTEDDVATASVIADGFSLAFSGMDKSRKAFINFPQRLLLDDSVYALPREICVVEVLETITPTPEMIAALRRLKEHGYVIALDDYVGQPGFEEVIAMADIVKVEVLGMAPDKLKAIGAALQKFGCRLLAEKVEDRATYDLCKSYGFSLFQGFYFSRPETMTGSKVPTPVLAKMRLLRALTGEDFDVRELARIISSDPSVTYRLLNFINSAAFSLRSKIQSIQQALTLLGKQQIKQWFLAVIISDFDSTSKVQEAAYTSLQRARYLESMGKLFKNASFSPETLFLLGLFSRLDVLLAQPMNKLLENIPLDKEVEAALLSKPSPYWSWLSLVEDIEVGNWDDVEDFLDSRGLDRETSAINYTESIQWTQTLLKCKADTC
ncbi:EAL and HDOD domain-containing protein [Humidesulfovibrio sp.]|uniref:EAL and HDOD domain-containing protein n=1 Tax=Humidesulfovibrio sp. TaxID=2910988 RepID=UPI00280B6EE9|nr:HDOD domain-containing protein [Humidesulfovibrio sp.]